MVSTQNAHSAPTMVPTAPDSIPAQRAPKTEAPWREADEIRYRNYEALRQRLRDKEGRDLPERGALQRFAAYVDIPYKYVGHIEHKRKKIGRQIAAKLEAAFNLPPGWLDVDRAAGTLVMDEDAREFAETAMRLYLKDRPGVRAALMRYMETKLR